MMRKKITLIILLLMLMNVPFAQAANMWTANSSIVSGLPVLVSYSDPAVFNDNGVIKLISGNGTGVWHGFYWDESIWVSDPSIVSGLTDVGDHSSPAVFNDSGTLKLISGSWGATFTGWYWDGSTWVLDSSIVSGLTSDIDRETDPAVFLDGSTWKLISGQGDSFEYTDTLTGWYWGGSSWVSDPSVVAGTSDSLQFSSPTVFTYDGTLYLISGHYWGGYQGWYWSGSTWVSDSSLVSGLTDAGYQSAPAIFYDGNNLKAILGGDDGIFYGCDELISYTLSGTVTNEDGAVNNTTITLSDSGGSTISNETGYYEITGVIPDTYTITATEVLHEDYSDSVTITSDTEKDILLTIIPTGHTPTNPPILVPMPVIPIQEATPFVEADEEVTILEEIMTKIETLISEEILVFGIKAFSWIFILASYVGAFAYSLIRKNEDENAVYNILFLGTIGWALPILINSLGIISTITNNLLFNVIIFTIFGFVSYGIYTLFMEQD